MAFVLFTLSVLFVSQIKAQYPDFPPKTVTNATAPYDMYLTDVGTTSVYELFGKQDLIMSDEKPQLDVGHISGNIVYRYHNGGHTDAPDWPVFFAFASKYINENTHTFGISATTLKVSGSANSTTTFEIQSDVHWTITGTESWLSATPDSGIGKRSITLTVRENPDDEVCSAALTVSATRFQPKTIQVYQEPLNPMLFVASSRVDIDSFITSAIISVLSNTIWNISCSESWLSISPTSGINNRQVGLLMETNLDTMPRTAKLTLTANGVTPQNLTVSQALTPRLSVSTVPLSIADSTNSTTTFKIASNTGWRVISSKNWLTVDPASGSKNGIVTLTAEQNPNTKIRSAVVNVSVHGLSTKSIRIKQNAAETSIKK